MTIMPILFREARTDDIEALHTVRMAVRENILSNPSLVTRDHYVRYLTTQGRGWVCEREGGIAGFAIVDTEGDSVWALFVHPDQEGKGIGRALHDQMLDWYFAHYGGVLWLTTGPGTRAEAFYRRAGWRAVGVEASGELRFEMGAGAWKEKGHPKVS